MPEPYQTQISKEDVFALYRRRLLGKNAQDPLPARAGAVFDALYALQAAQDALPLIVPYVELCITTRCTLSCVYCSNLMPRYRGKAADFATRTLCLAVASFLGCVDSVKRLRIMGGEPFLHPELDVIIKAVACTGKIGSIAVVTNGTLVPGKAVLQAMRETKTRCEISNYGKHSTKVDALCAALCEHGIPFSMADELYWKAHLLEPTRYSEEELKQVYAACTIPCKTIVNDEFHVCPRSGHGGLLGLTPRQEGEFVDLLRTTKEKLRGKIRALYNLDSLAACALCKRPTDYRIIPAGEQA